MKRRNCKNPLCDKPLPKSRKSVVCDSECAEELSVLCQAAELLKSVGVDLAAKIIIGLIKG